MPLRLTAASDARTTWGSGSTVGVAVGVGAGEELAPDDADGASSAACSPDRVAPAAVHPARRVVHNSAASHREGPDAQDRHLDRPAANDRLGFDITNNDDR
jgi:hypothetical protein